MGPIEVAFWAACLVLVAAGATKLLEPDPLAAALGALGVPSTVGGASAARVIGVAELAVGVAGLALGGRAVAGIAAALYAAFAAVVVLARSRGLPSCGCFGQRSAPPSPLHAGVDAVAALACLAAVVRPVAAVAEAPGGAAATAVGVAAALLVALAVVAVQTR